jgi:hypothetical protein
LGRLWWFDFIANTVHFFDGKRAENFDFQLANGEKILSLKSITKKSELLIATNQRIAILGLDGHERMSLSLQEISGPDLAAKINIVLVLNDNEILVEASNAENRRYFFGVNLKTGTSTLEADFKKTIGEFGISRSTQWGDKSYVLTNSPYAVIMQRANGKWKKMGDINDYKHVTPLKDSAPWWFTVDNFDRIWFVTARTPYKLGRLDPEWAP